MVRQAPYSIGYVELIYAEANHIQYGMVRNMAGKYVKASTGGVTAAAAALAKKHAGGLPESRSHQRSGPDSYPISSFTWLLLPTKFQDPAKAKAMQGFMEWMLSTGESEAAGMTYAPLPKAVAESRGADDQDDSLGRGCCPAYGPDSLFFFFFPVFSPGAGLAAVKRRAWIKMSPLIAGSQTKFDERR